MRRTIQTTFLEFTVFLLANNLFTCAAHSQTVDSLNVLSGGTSSDQAAMINTVIPLPDGKILAGGQAIKFISSGNKSYTNLVCLNSDGSVDTNFSVSIGPVNCVALQTNGQILAAGSFSEMNRQTRYNIGRLYANGTLDASFNAGYVNMSIYCLLVQPDGKILVGGTFTMVNSQPCFGLCRLNYDGSLDTNFNAGANGSIKAIALQPDGRIVVEGSFTSIGGQSRTDFARLYPDGSLDPGFQPVAFQFFGGPRISGFGGALWVQPDGKILVGGLFDKVNGLSHTNIVRLNADGTLDAAFNAQADLYDCWGLQTLTLQTDGKILVGDDSLTLDGQLCPYLGRLMADGSLDAGFNTNLVSSGWMVFSSAVQPDGRILVGGWFDSLGGQTRNGLGRLINTGMAKQSLDYDGTNILWLRGGTSPEVWRTSFESSTNGTNWTCLGDGCHVDGGWRLTNVSISTSATIRARGFVAGGRCDGSSWFVETSLSPLVPLRFVGINGNPPVSNGCFNVRLTGAAGSNVVVECSSDLTTWTPWQTNTLPSGGWDLAMPLGTNRQQYFRAKHAP
jgi:uncharacterized delta-60 repeat protein